ncbi:hypothetical protein L1987_66020 [Smallanthus sonchifolius]|uniref:Uncharacterized protein n=1 Tax=Smallanthus sonchifolius TaxID=185202 RepID=A0ACB9BW22_9ASTR|nr:hypothetical protein L1987_66020 [Smallanthus sonchifolius]
METTHSDSPFVIVTGGGLASIAALHDASFRILLTHLRIQFCKNIVLAGVGSLTLNDDNPVIEEALGA